MKGKAIVTGGSEARSPLMILIAVCIVQFMAPFMLSSVGIALPSMGRDLGASAMQLGLIEQLYLLSLAMTMLTFGRLGDIIGQKKIFITGLVIFTIFTASIGFIRNVHLMMLLRFIQGWGASMMMSGSMAIVTAAYPPEERTKKIGIVSAFTYTGLSLGPVIGGFLTTHFGWQYTFLAPALIGIAGIIASAAGMHGMTKNASDDKMDWKGSVWYAVGIGIIMTGAAHARTPLLGVPLIIIGLICMAVFFKIESGAKIPLLDLSLLTHNRYFSLSCLAALGNYAATAGITFMMSLYLQYAKGFSAKVAGYVLIVSPVMQVITSLLAGQLSRWFETAKIATAGMIMSAVGLLCAAATLSTETPVIIIALELMLIGSGFGIFITPNSSAIMGSVEKKQLGVASGMIGAMRTLGMAVSMTSVALILSIFMSSAPVTAHNVPFFLTAMRTALVLFAVYACLGITISFRRIKRASKKA